jgi:hypothetical protein
VKRLLALTLLVVVSGCPRKSQSTPPRPSLGARIDRMGRALTANALLGPLGSIDDAQQQKEEYNRAAVADWPKFTEYFERTLGLYDGFDRVCGNQWLADRGSESTKRYHALARLLADDRLWINGGSTRCTKYLAIELAETDECGGRTPNEDAVDVFRSLLVTGSTTGIDDGVDGDDKVHSTTDFPFLAAP